jgi:Mrp family chromosome partitioning ATPase
MIEHRELAENGTRLHALEPPPEQPVDLSRYWGALYRSRVLIAAIVATLTGIVLGLSLALPKTYTANATVLVDESPDVTASADVERQLATIQTLLTTRDVLTRAAARLPGESADALAGKVHASVDPKANIIHIRASASTATGAARTANAVARAFLARQRSLELRRLEAARARLLEAMTRLRGSPGARGEIALIRERFSELSVSEANAGSELQLADAARPPAAAASPRPFRNAIFAFVAGLFIAVLAALGRERIAPRMNGPRELERLSGLPVLSVIPQVNPRVGRNGAFAPEREAYEALVGLIGTQLPASPQHTLLVTSALADEGKARVAAGLARALAHAGETTLVVDADLRRPSLEQLFGMEPAPGLTEILAAARNGDPDAASEMIAEPPAPAGRRGAGSLAVLGAGEAPSPRMVSDEAVELFFAELSRSGFTYIVIQGPPLLGPADCRFWAQRVEGVLVASQPDRLTPRDVVATRELLPRLDADVLGYVVVGGRGGLSV